MSRGLTISEQNILASTGYQTEDHLRIVFRTPTVSGTTVTYTTTNTYRYTTGERDIAVTDDGTYLAASYITGFNYPNESYEINPGNMTIVFERFDSSFYTELESPNIGSSIVQAWKVLLNASTKAISARFELFNGTISGVDITRTRATQTLNLRCSNNYSQFNRRGGRNVSDLSQAPIYNTFQWRDIQIS